MPGKKAALMIVFDEGNNSFPSDLVYAVLVGPVVKTATKSTTMYSHYSILATLEANWGLASLVQGDVGAPSFLSDAFK